MHSGLSSGERQERLVDLRVGRLRALAAPTVLDEGIDVPEVNLGVVLGGSKSRRQMIQRMGRVLRLKRQGGKATFLVVYANGTAEDLTQCSGQEGCLDLIIAAADSVTYAKSAFELVSRFGDPVTASDDAASSTFSAEVLRGPSGSGKGENLEGTLDPAEERSGAAIRKVANDVGSDRYGCASDSQGELVDPRLLALDALTVPMTRRAVVSYQRAHGVSAGEAESSLRSILADFVSGCETRMTATHGVFIAARDGFELALAADRFAGYRSRRADGLTWAEVRDAPSAEGNVDPPRRLSPDAGRATSTGTAETAVQVNFEPKDASAPPADLIASLERLVNLYRDGLLTVEEFSAAKSKLLF